MSGGNSFPAPEPMEPRPGVRVHTAADRRLAVEHWLLAAHPEPKQARAEWAEHGVALLRLGTLFSAVRIPGRLIQAVAATTDPRELDTFLEDALDGGPVISDPGGNRYYALVPASVPRTWRAAVDDWSTQNVEVLGCGTYLGVPRVDAVEYRPLGTYWSVPMPSAAVLCPPLTVARLIAAAVHQLADIPEGTDGEPPRLALLRPEP
ncbi:hypothetical protein GCM10014715_81520 [Streptomyces spiralis]|uniref:DNA primase/polymerase bifunctional N-terminal domain-containing protein n=1 Tax=Streptomyces spiralis TaxID=66376 RepID=A0A919E511_9ACTN|nr:hypothetical protein [Streptomyces spiralis]GHF13630.1 hypothetical protein GCM10014715_81520 [Streptomyces spiralis]